MLLLGSEALSGSWTHSQDAVPTYKFQIHTGSKSEASLYVYLQISQ